MWKYNEMKWINITILLLWVFVWSLFYPKLAGGALNESCRTDCICCEDQICGASAWFPDTCIKGCIDGHRGVRCYEICTHNCTSCDGHIDICEGCYDGFYLGVNKDCNSECPANCKTCISDTKCTACKDGFENRNGSQACEYSICPQHCICNKTICASCKKGFYNTTNSCFNTCPQTCQTCVSSEYCDKCKTGYFNGKEFDISFNPHLNNCTYTCMNSCISCSSYNSCLECSTGKFGVNCQEKCSVGCIDSSCAMNTGTCKCLSNFSGEKCTESITGKYGNMCDISCPVNCRTNVCDRFSGNCTEGCVKDHFTGDKCNICINGMYGEHCDTFCPENCRNNKCNKDTGACSNGCKNNFDGTTCKECIDGRFGEKCEHDCSETCANNICKRQTGNCFQCIGNFVREKCNVCKSGFYGSNCDQKCSLNCFNDTCGIDKGVCTYGCKRNHSGDKCCLDNENCIDCSSSTKCKKCKSGYFTSSCKQRCQVECLGSCDFTTGVCGECIANHYGQFCELTCSGNCKDSQVNIRRCASANGACIFGCKDGFFGFTCNETCSSLCVDSVCTRERGICVKGCTGRYHNPVCLPSSGKPQDGQDDSSTLAIIAVLSTLLAVTSTALFILVLKKIIKKIRSTDRQTEESVFQVHYENSSVGKETTQTEYQTAVSGEENISYEILDRTDIATEHTYDTANPNVIESTPKVRNIEYENFQL